MNRVKCFYYVFNSSAVEHKVTKLCGSLNNKLMYMHFYFIICIHMRCILIIFNCNSNNKYILLQTNSKNISFCLLGEASSLFPDMSPTVSKEIEDEANSYFQRIYNHPPHPTLSIDEVLEMLKKFQDSPNKRERVSVFLYIIDF